MLESIFNFLTEHRTLLLYLIIGVAALALVYIYVKKYINLMGENDTSQLKDEFQQLRLDVNKLKTNSQQLNSKFNDINTRVKYGQISSSGKGSSGNNGQLPFTIECMENTPFYNVIGPHLFNAVIGDSDDLTPTNKQVEDITVGDDDVEEEEANDRQVEEMSEPPSCPAQAMDDHLLSDEESTSDSEEQMSDQDSAVDDIPASIRDVNSLVSGDLVLGPGPSDPRPTVCEESTVAETDDKSESPVDGARGMPLPEEGRVGSLTEQFVNKESQISNYETVKTEKKKNKLTLSKKNS
jgi:predicted small secreted protein